MPTTLTGSLIYQRIEGLDAQGQPILGPTFDLNDMVNTKLRHHDGFGIGEFAHTTAASPGLHGDFWFGVKYAARTLTVDVILMAAGLGALQTLRARLIDVLNPSVFSGRLELIQANGAALYFDCVLAESLPMPTFQHIGQRGMTLSLRFRSTGAPFFYSPVAQQYTVNPGVAAGNFMVGGFTFPFTLSQSGVFNEVVLTYPGHVPTPVEIRFYGPGIEPVMRNQTLGRTIGFLGSGLSLGQGTLLYINTDPRYRDVTVPGVNGWSYLRESGFWWLQPGPNRLSFELGGSTPATYLTMTYLNRYLGV
jgi:Phage tail protein RIFT-related domain/Siphovirus-type tail component, C-terminal domain